MGGMFSTSHNTFQSTRLVDEAASENVHDLEDNSSEKVKPKEEEFDERLVTCPFDPRFPHPNQTKRCFINFVDYHRCDRVLGSYDRCEPFYKCYMSMCPTEWIEKWEEQIEKGCFPVQLPPKNSKTNKENHNSQSNTETSEK